MHIYSYVLADAAINSIYKTQHKSTRDLKAIQPILAKIKEQIPEIEKLDNDGLRDRINQVRRDIANATEADNQAIAKLRNEVEGLPFDQRQPLGPD